MKPFEQSGTELKIEFARYRDGGGGNYRTAGIVAVLNEIFVHYTNRNWEKKYTELF